jgi:YbbR domain-containing protein
MMFSSLRAFLKYLPSLLMAFALAVAVWISAVTAADPNEERVYARPVTLEVIGQDPTLVVVSTTAAPISLTLSAPRSVHERMLNEQVAVRAIADYSGLGVGTHTVPVQIQVGVRPVGIVSYSPQVVSITLEKLSRQVLPVRLVKVGEVAVGFQSESPVLSETEATITGAESAVSQVVEVKAVLELNLVNESFIRTLPLQAVNSVGQVVTGVTLIPDKITVNQVVTQRGGYRNVVVRVSPVGKIANGYRLTNITVSPPAITVFSSDPKAVNDLPGYVETAPLDLTGVNDDFDVRLQLNLPQGISVVGAQTVLVQVAVSTIEGSVTLPNLKVEVSGLKEGLAGTTSPETVVVILSGPLPVLENLKPENLRVYVDMTDQRLGTYQRTPKVELRISGITVESILPESLEVVVSIARITPTPTK